MGVSISTGQWDCCLRLSRVLLRVVAVFLSAVFTMASSQSASLSPKETKALEIVTQGTNKFAVSLYRSLAAKQEGNVFVSPLSVQLVLALAYTGAKGATAAELAKLLQLPENLTDTCIGYHALIKLLENPVLKVANRMFVETSAPLKQEFQSNAEKHFLSPAEAVDFIQASEAARTHINSWVENQTNKKITNLLAPGVVDSLTRLVLVNAIHFKANWKLKFDEENTKEKPFHVSKTKTVPVQMMNIKKKFGFKHDEELKAKILELEYENRDFRMLVILPDEIDGLAELESKLATVDLSEKLRYFAEPTVTVALPKFKLEETMDLNNILKSLGASTMFTPSADFSGLSDQALMVSKVVQKAFVEVNEEGTEAAAATGMTFLLGASPGKPPPDEVFIADHPFTFLLTPVRFNAPLFVGRFNSPL